MRGMVIDMNDEQLRTMADLQGFLDGTVAMDFTVAEEERYEFISRTVRRFGYGRLKRADKAVVLRFLERVSGYSRQQITRLVKRGGERRQLAKRYRGVSGGVNPHKSGGNKWRRILASTPSGCGSETGAVRAPG